LVGMTDMFGWKTDMRDFGLIEYEQASPEVRAVYDDIMVSARRTT